MGVAFQESLNPETPTSGPNTGITRDSGHLGFSVYGFTMFCLGFGLMVRGFMLLGFSLGVLP